MTPTKSNYLDIPDDYVHEIVARCGESQQDAVLSEECGELIQAVTKTLRQKNAGKPVNNSALAEEMAHVLICIRTTMLAHGITPEDIQEHIDYKIDKYQDKSYAGNI